MKQIGCEHESSILRALRSGEWTTELRRHVAECPDCAEALRLAEALRGEARRAETRAQLPDPHWIFARGRQRAQELAMRRMVRLLMVARAVAVIYGLGATAWLLRGFAGVPVKAITSEFSGAAFHGTSNGYVLMGVALTAASAVIGLWPILREGHGNREGLRR